MFKPTLLIDFDETITTARGFDSPPNRNAVDAINLLKEKYKIIIYSCHANKNICSVYEHELLLEYLSNHGIYYDEISTRKPIFFALIDDRSYNPKRDTWDGIVNTLLNQCSLVDTSPDASTK